MAFRQRPAGHHDFLRVQVVAQRSIERETVRIDPQRHHRLLWVQRVHHLAKSRAARQGLQNGMRGESLPVLDQLAAQAVFEAGQQRQDGGPFDAPAGQPADLLVPRLAGVVQALRQRHVAGDPTVGPAGEGTELGALRLDGSRFPATGWVTPLRTRRGMLVAATVRDLTRQHETDARLQRLATRAQEHQDMAGAVLAAVTEVALVLADSHGRITAVNPAAQRLLGYRAEELVGLPTTRLSDEDDMAVAAGELGLPARADPLL